MSEGLVEVTDAVPISGFCGEAKMYVRYLAALAAANSPPGEYYVTGNCLQGKWFHFKLFCTESQARMFRRQFYGWNSV